MFKRSKKNEEEYEEKRKASGILKVFVVVFVLVFVLLLIPEEWFEKKSKELSQQGMSSEVDDRKEQEVLDIVEKNFDGTVKFNTIFGGVDYQQEYDDFWAENTLEGHELLEEHLSTIDLAAIFSEIPSENTQMEDSIIEEVLPENPFSLGMLETADYIRFSSMTERVCIGVVQDYYAVSWIKGTSFIFVNDYSKRYFDDCLFTRQMMHFGKIITDGFSVSEVRVESFDKFTIVYVGGNR